jgi:hypothetical protein
VCFCCVQLEKKQEAEQKTFEDISERVKKEIVIFEVPAKIIMFCNVQLNLIIANHRDTEILLIRIHYSKLHCQIRALTGSHEFIHYMENCTFSDFPDLRTGSGP